MEKRFLIADFLLFVIYLFSIVSPFLMVNYVWEVSSDVVINPTVVNGLISLSGILFGFVTATATIRRTPQLIHIMLIINLILFYYIANEIFEATVRQESMLNTITWATASLLSNFIAAGALLFLRLMQRIRE